MVGGWCESIPTPKVSRQFRLLVYWLDVFLWYVFEFSFLVSWAFSGSNWCFFVSKVNLTPKKSPASLFSQTVLSSSSSFNSPI